MISRHSNCLFIVSVACFGLVPHPSQPWASAEIVPSYQLQATSDLSAQPAENQSKQVVDLQTPQKRLGDLKPSSTPFKIAQIQPSKTAPSAKENHPSPKEWLLGILGVSAVAGGLSFFGLRRRSQQDLPDPALLAAENSLPQPDLEHSIESLEVKPSREELPQTNGHLQTISVSETSKHTESIDSSQIDSPKVSETTRLAKINIVDELLRELRSPDPIKRQKVIWELGQRGDSRAVQPMVDLMLDSDSKQRSLILSALSEIGTRTLKPLSRALAISLQDESPDVRKNAIRDLTRVYDLVSQISHLLHNASDDPDRDVQETALWALGQLNRIRSVPSNSDLPAFKNSVSPPENLP